MMLLDCDPGPTEETTYGYCAHCEKDVPVVKRDIGIGRYEYQGCKGIDRRMKDHCCECGEEI